MNILVQPWFLLLFAVVMFLVFFAVGKLDYKARKPITSLEQWIIAAICLAIVCIGVLKIQRDYNRNSFESQTEHAPISVR